MHNEKKEIAYSAIQPSGTFTIGNYFGALKNWVNLQNDFDCIFCVANLHAITVPQVPADLRRRTYEAYALLLAMGIDPEKSIVYVQSQVHQHAELSWILNNFTYMGELSRMTQYKDKSQKQGKNIRVGLFDYPVLMAADILLYQTNYVPIGADQKQHVEICRDIAERFNTTFSPTFTLPEPYFGLAGARVKSLQEPEKKMSKSDTNVNAFVSLLDDRDTIIRKFKRAVTDSKGVITYDMQEQPGISNLLEIYSCAADKSLEEAQKEFAGKGYGDFKLAVGETVADALEPLQQEFTRLLSDKGALDVLMKDNADKAAYLAEKTLRKVKKKVGIL
ncbi:MAG: tryptophan--tRNA ligase [Eubacteriaceae bacterium]|jgi:tryptophanyl-tRNA synthetase